MKKESKVFNFYNDSVEITDEHIKFAEENPDILGFKDIGKLKNNNDENLNYMLAHCLALKDEINNLKNEIKSLEEFYNREHEFLGRKIKELPEEGGKNGKIGESNDI